MTDPFTSDLKSPLHANESMRTVVSDRARLQRMLDFEAALARAEGARGVISATDAVEIAEACVAERYDLAAIAETATQTGDIAAAVVEALSRDVARYNPKAANFVHWGASSQDLIDTALMLELRAVIDALLADLDTAIKGFIALAGRHRRTLTAARSMINQAQPIPFGLKLASYAAALARSRDRLIRLRREAVVLQFGGTGGTLAALDRNGVEVSERLAALLDIAVAEAPWHGHRDRIAEVGASFAVLAGSCAKIARDVALLMPFEVGEVIEPRRHLTGAAVVLSAAAQAPNLAATLIATLAQDHEGGFGGSQTEWVTIPALALVTSGALDAVVKIAEGLEVDVERMRTNLERSGGRIMAEAVLFALAEKIEWTEARQLVTELNLQADGEAKPLRDVMLADARIKQHLSTTEIELLFVPATYLGSAQLFIDRSVFAAQPRTARWTDFRMPERFPVKAAEEISTLVELTPPEAAANSQPIAPAAPVEPLLQDATVAPDNDDDNLGVVPEPAASEFAEPESEGPPAAIDRDAPSAFMDVLSRAEAEARAEEERKPS